MNRRPVLVFDLIAGADAERHPVVRFRIVAFEGGEPPDFLPEWVEVERLDLAVIYDNPPAELRPVGTRTPCDAQLLEPRDAAGAIHGFLERYKTTHRGRPFVTLAHASPGKFTQLQTLFRMYDKTFPWRLTKVQLPAGVVERVKL